MSQKNWTQVTLRCNFTNIALVSVIRDTENLHLILNSL